jgi:hypothetical protein
MNSSHLRRLATATAVLSVVLFAAMVNAAPVVRLVGDPKLAGLHVAASDLIWEGNVLTSMRLAVANDSTNVLTIDPARSFIVSTDGEPQPLAALVRADFAKPLLPGEETSDEIDLLDAFQHGDRFKVSLVWTLGAIVDAAVWVWEVTDVAGEASPQKTPPTPGEISPATASSSAADGASGNVFLGVVAIVLGVALVGLLVWGLWSLLQ